MSSTGVVLIVVAVLAAFLAVLGAASAIVWLRIQNQDGQKKGTKARQTPYLEELAARVAAVEVKVDDLPGVWEEARERAKQQADRSAAALRDLEKKLAAIADEQDPFGDLLGDDESGSGDQPMLALHEGLGEDASDDVETRAAEALAAFGRR